jgi:EAL domain-containing protein (putative c-di-GMP-specific phosphodiesterase class I)
VDPQLLETVHACLAECGMQPDELQLEITESVLAEAGATIKTIQSLAAMGVRLALDDFGTGFSSLSYLRTYPIHTIKIDQSFVKDLPHNSTACKLVEAMLAMANAVQRDVVAEGVETTGQLDFLTAAGCRNLQGYLLGRPMEGDDMIAFAEKNRACSPPERRQAQGAR